MSPNDSDRPSCGQDDRAGRRKGRPPSPMVLAGAGAEFGLAVAALTLGGWWLDGKLDCRPWLMLTGLAIGTIGGIYNLYRQGKRFFED